MYVPLTLVRTTTQTYVQRVEDLLGVPIKWIGVGPGRDAIVVKD